MFHNIITVFMKIGIYIIEEDLAIAIKTFLNLRNINSEIIDIKNLKLHPYDILIVESCRGDLVLFKNKLTLTDDQSLKNDPYHICTPFTAMELLLKIEGLINK